MKTFFTKRNILFEIREIIVIAAFILYFLISMILNKIYTEDYKKFNTIVDSLFSKYKDSFDIYLNLKKELEIYEDSLINSEKIGEFEQIKLPKVNEIEIPTLGNIIMRIT